MGDKTTEELLLQLIQDMAYVRATLENIKDQNLGGRIDSLEAECKEYKRVIQSLENRTDKLEDFTRNQIVESKRQQTSIIVSVSVAIISAVISAILAIFI